MKVITEPTIQVGEEFEQLTELGFREDEFQKHMQAAFEAGIEVGSNKPAPAAVSVSKGKIPFYRTDWELINEDAPENKIEEFIYRQLPNDEQSNPEAWLAQLRQALEYVCK